MFTTMPPPRWSMATILTLGTVLIISLLMALSTLVDIRRERGIFHDKLEERGRLTFRMLGALAANPDFPNQEGLSEVLAVVMSQPALSYFHMSTPDGLTLASSGNTELIPPPAGSAATQAAQGAGPVLDFDGDALYVTGAIEKGSTVVAIVEFGFDSAPLSNEIREIAGEHLIQAFIFIALGVLMSYLLAQHFVRPIRRLVNTAREVSEGEFSVHAPLDSHRNDEIGDLSAAFSNMVRALQNFRDKLEEMFEEEQRKSAHLEALKDIAELGLADRPPDELFQSLLERIMWAHHADGGSIFIHDRDKNTLEPLVLAGVGADVMGPRLFHPDNGVLARVVSEARSMVIEDVLSSPLVFNQGIKDVGVKTLVASPLKVGERSIGVVSLHYRSPFAAEDCQLGMIELMAEGVAHVIERARLLERERQQSAELASVNEANVKMMRELELAQQRDIQSAKMAAVGQLAGGIAHEINNPLASIMGFAQLAKQKLPSGRGEAIVPHYTSILERYLTYIDNGAKRCGQIVSKLQSFTRSPEQEISPMDVNELLEQAVRLTTNQVGLSTTRLETQLADELPMVSGNSASIVQVFTNIINNATRAVPGEGGTLKVTSRLPESGDEARRPMVEIAFEDNGAGISEENLPKVFEPFFTTAEPGQGTGLGLYVCYQVVRQHDGEIYIHSKEGKGTTVTVRLPVYEGE